MILKVYTSLLLLFLVNSVWTRTVRQVYDDLDPGHWSHYTSECPQECFCPPSFPNALYCDNKGLKEIPPIPARIWYLYLQNNQIETISEKPFANATHLRWINLNKNKITNSGIENGVLSKLKRLLYLFLEDNELEEVPAPLPVGLEQLRLARNKISKIPEGVFSHLQNLTMLDLHQNSLLDSALQSDTFQGLNNLMQLNIAKNSLKKMPLSIPANTLQLFLDNNSIEVIPENYFSAIPKVTFLRLNYNKLSDDGIPPNGFNVSSILDLQLSHNQLTKIPPINAHLEHLHLDHNKIKSKYYQCETLQNHLHFKCLLNNKNGLCDKVIKIMESLNNLGRKGLLEVPLFQPSCNKQGHLMRFLRALSSLTLKFARHRASTTSLSKLFLCFAILQHICSIKVYVLKGFPWGFLRQGFLYPRQQKPASFEFHFQDCFQIHPGNIEGLWWVGLLHTLYNESI